MIFDIVILKSFEFDVIVNMMNMINILDHFLINNIIWLVID
jgi:hypothetical protein